MRDKFQDYLIVSDLDGTFFGDNPKLVPKNLEAIRYFQERGGIFTIATGRDYKTLNVIFPEAKDYLSGPAILCNGVYLYDFQKNEVMDECSLEKNEFLILLEEITRNFPEVGYRISSHEGYICPNISPFMEEKIQSYLSLIIRSDTEPYLEIPWHKCVFVAPPETIQKIAVFASTLPMKHHVSIPSFATLLEILPKNSGKGNKIQSLKSFYPKRKAICVGDYTNDLDMLSVADIAACPENALDEVKSISQIHLCHHRDGCIADLIYKLDSSIKE